MNTQMGAPIEDKGIIYAILSVMPSIGSVWGLVFYAVFTYMITFCIVGGVHYWANKNIDVNQIVK